MSTEQEKFLESIEPDNRPDVFEKPIEPETPSGPDTEGDKTIEQDEDALKPRNRRERRLTEKLQAERESSMFLAGKLEARTEASKALTEDADYLKAVERIYGTDTPEAQLATELLKKAITGSRDDAENRAYERMRADREAEQGEVAQATDELDNMIDEIEDTNGVTLTEAQEVSFFQLLEKMSPKDRDGNVREYADHHAVWDVFQERLNRRGTDTRAKDLAARSMVQGGSSTGSKLIEDTNTRFLKDNGII